MVILISKIVSHQSRIYNSFTAFNDFFYTSFSLLHNILLKVNRYFLVNTDVIFVVFDFFHCLLFYWMLWNVNTTKCEHYEIWTL